MKLRRANNYLIFLGEEERFSLFLFLLLLLFDMFMSSDNFLGWCICINLQKNNLQSNLQCDPEHLAYLAPLTITNFAAYISGQL